MELLGQRALVWQPERRAVVADVEVVLDRFLLRHGDRSVRITPMECMLLSALLSHPDEVLSRSALAEEAWGRSHRERGGEVEVYVARLRKKVAQIGGRGIIDTVRGEGYRLAELPTLDAAPRSAAPSRTSRRRPG
jgi:DNA-binding response OmpR family regulator